MNTERERTWTLNTERGREIERDLGGWGVGDKVSMTREVSDKCQGVVWRIWDKCGGWAWREGVDSRDGDLEGRDRPSADFGLGLKEEGGECR